MEHPPTVVVYTHKPLQCAFETTKGMLRRYKIRPDTLARWVELGAPCCLFGPGYGRRYPVAAFDRWVFQSFGKGDCWTDACE